MQDSQNQTKPNRDIPLKFIREHAEKDHMWNQNTKEAQKSDLKTLRIP